MPAVDLEPEALVSVDAIVAAAAQQQAQVGRACLLDCPHCRRPGWHGRTAVSGHINGESLG
jgi:hypothetical protein